MYWTIQEHLRYKTFYTRYDTYRVSYDTDNYGYHIVSQMAPTPPPPSMLKKSEIPM